MSIEIDGKMYDEGDPVSINGRKGVLWKFYKADGIISVAVKYDNSVYEMFLAENLVIDD